jgi:hypothetical protein
MDENKPSRRGFLRGLTLTASGLLLGAARSSFGAVDTQNARKWGASKPGAIQHCIEGMHLPLAGQDKRT